MATIPGIKARDRILTTNIKETQIAKRDEQDKHIVDALIEERATRLLRSPFWPLYRAILYPLLLHKKAVRLADAVAPLAGYDVMDHVSKLLTIKLSVTGLEKRAERRPRADRVYPPDRYSRRGCDV